MLHRPAIVAETAAQHGDAQVQPPIDRLLEIVQEQVTGPHLPQFAEILGGQIEGAADVVQQRHGRVAVARLKRA